MAIREIPEEAVALVKRFEGLHDPIKGTPLLEPYHDPIGLPTIGYGHLLSHAKWADLRQWPAITPEDAESLLVADLAAAARGVIRLVKVPLTDGQYGALVSFTFNVGAGLLKASNLLRKVNTEDHLAASEQFGRWVYAGGVKLPGLVKRRKAEAALYLADL